MDFQLDRSTGFAVGIVLMPGRMDVVNSRELQQLFPHWLDLAERIVFDCSGLDFVDSSGLGAIVSCLRRAIDRDGDLRLAALAPGVAMIFDLTRASTLFSIYEDTISAIRSFTILDTTETAGR